MYRFSGII